MAPSSKRIKLRESTKKETSLYSVLEWFDTTTKPPSIVCREKEHKKIKAFIMNCLDSEQGGSLYLCGSPGIGKSLLLDNILSTLKEDTENNLKTIYINAMALNKNQVTYIDKTNLKDIYSSLCQYILNEKKSWEKAKQSLEQSLLKHTSRKRIPIIICIDEIDRLLTKERTIVYDLFEWPYMCQNVIIVIGIANSIDLIEKSLPLLKLSKKRKPETYVFPSYTEQDLKKIIQQRIQLCNDHLKTNLTLFQPNAITLCCKKMEEIGDARRLLDICKTALQATYSNEIVTNDKIVTIPTMSKILFQFFQSTQISRIEGLPRLAQILLACLCGMIKEMEDRKQKDKTKLKSYSISCSKLKDVFNKVYKAIIGGTRSTVAEFNQLLDQLINNGICKIVELKRVKPMDRPVLILILISVDDLIHDLSKDVDFEKVVKHTWV